MCLANTAALLFHPEVTGDAVRAGIGLYGVSPDSHITSKELNIRPAMTLAAKIIAVQEIVPAKPWATAAAGLQSGPPASVL